MWAEVCSDAGFGLQERGFWVRDHAVSEDVAAEVREEILKCHEEGLLSQSGNKLAVRLPDGNRGGSVCQKRNVFEADLIVDGAVNCPEVLEKSPVLAALLAQEGQLRKAFGNLGQWLRIDRLEQAKVQVNTSSGGAFPCHFDLPSQSGQGAKRLLTVLLYLNPQWVDGNGGEVEVLPFPFANTVLPPLNRRFVAFSSCTTLHRVRPFFGTNRVCLNLWFEGEAEIPFPAPLEADRFDHRVCNIVRILRQRPAELRAFCKVWYSDTMVQSLRDAFEECQACRGFISKLKAQRSRDDKTTCLTIQDHTGPYRTLRDPSSGMSESVKCKGRSYSGFSHVEQNCFCLWGHPF